MSGLVLDGLLVILALFLVALNGLFVAAEFGLVKIRSTQVDGLVREGRRSSGLLKKATDKLDAYLSVCQLGITISSLGLGALGEPAIASLLEPVLAAAGFSEALIHAIAFAVGFGIITFLHVVFGELAPKSVAIARAEGTSLFVAPFMRFFYLLFYPGVVVFNGVANAAVRLFGVPPASETEEEHSEEELRLIVGRSTCQGVLNTGEQHMLEGGLLARGHAGARGHGPPPRRRLAARGHALEGALRGHSHGRAHALPRLRGRPTGQDRRRRARQGRDARRGGRGRP